MSIYFYNGHLALQSTRVYATNACQTNFMIFDIIFSQIGLSAADAQVYEKLMVMKDGTPSAIARAASVSRENAYYILKKLVEVGLVVQVPEVRQLTFRVAPANSLQRLFEDKERQLNESK